METAATTPSRCPSGRYVTTLVRLLGTKKKKNHPPMQFLSAAKSERKSSKGLMICKPGEYSALPPLRSSIKGTLYINRAFFLKEAFFVFPFFFSYGRCTQPLFFFDRPRVGGTARRRSAVERDKRVHVKGFMKGFLPPCMGWVGEGRGTS